MNQPTTEPKKNANSGISLIEVIVAMLVLAIIIGPLFNGFLMSGRTNVNTRKKQYANTVASNVMEGIKEYGIERTALQVNEFEPFRLLPNEGLLDDYAEMNADFTEVITPLGSVNGVNSSVVEYATGKHRFNARIYPIEPSEPTYDADFAGKYHRKYYYLIKGIIEGTMKYDARIIFDATAYDAKPTQGNNFLLADLSTLNATTTVVVCPSGVFYTVITDMHGNETYDTSKNFESEALRVFQERYEDHMDNLYVDKCNAIEDMNNRIYDAVTSYITSGLATLTTYLSYFPNAAGNDINIDQRQAAYDYYFDQTGIRLQITDIPQDVSTVLHYNPLTSVAAFYGRITRKTLITIVFDETEGKYVVNSSVMFTFDNSTGVIAGYDVAGLGLVCEPGATNEADMTTSEGSGYCVDLAFNGIENIYLFQDACRGVQRFADDVIEIDYGDTEFFDSEGDLCDVGIYIAWQYEPTAIPSPLSLELYFTGTQEQAERFHVYKDDDITLVPWNNGGLFAFDAVEDRLVTDLTNTDRAYKVTVQIYESGTDTMVAELSSMIKE